MKDYSNLQPIKNNVLLKQADFRDKVGSIHLPDDVGERPQEATIIRLGNGPFDEGFFWEVEEGDRVLIEKYGGTDLGDGLRIMPWTSLVAVLETDPETGDETMIPLDDFVVARMLPPEEKAGRFFLADQSKQAHEFGIVMLTGDNVGNVKQEDQIYINRVQGLHYRVGGNDYVVIREPKIHLCRSK